MPTPDTIQSQDYKSGIRVVWSESGDTIKFCKAIASHAADKSWALALVWFSAGRHDAEILSQTLHELAPELKFCGCSTSGEITPDGLQESGIVSLLLPSEWFSASVCVIPEVTNLGMEKIAQRASETRIEFLQSLSSDDPVFAMNMIDGLAYSEELVTVALDRGLDGIPLIGGSAGDDLLFDRTWQLHDGKTYTSAAVVVLIQCRLPCQTFTNNNFVPTDYKLVVTEADPEQRKVIEFNAEPAAQAYAKAIGSTVQELNAGSFASHSVVVKSGGQYYCRSIQQLNDDDSLTFFCAIDHGLVLTVARSEGMVASSHAAIDVIEEAIGPIDMLFGFDCIYRKLDAQYRQTSHRIATLYRDANFIGFNTYGEQFNSMHINQTFTGVAIGNPPSQATKS